MEEEVVGFFCSTSDTVRPINAKYQLSGASTGRKRETNQ